MKNKYIYILNYFHANIEKLNTLRNFTLKHKGTIMLIGKKKFKSIINKQLADEHLKKMQPFIYSKTIIITVNKTFSDQKMFYEQIKSIITPLHIYIRGVIIDNNYLTTTNVEKLFIYNNNTINNTFYFSQIIYLYQMLKELQIVFLINTCTNSLLIKNVTLYKTIKYII